MVKAFEAEQEPVIGAYEVVNEEGDEWSLVYPAAVHKYKLIPEERITQTFYAAPVEPVKQEPVGYTAQSVIDWLSSDERTDVAEAEIRLKKKPSGRSNVPLYAAPVDAIAIRAEALEEAAKVYEEYAHLLGLETDCAAAIRGLK